MTCGMLAAGDLCSLPPRNSGTVFPSPFHVGGAKGLVLAGGVRVEVPRVSLCQGR